MRKSITSFFLTILIITVLILGFQLLDNIEFYIIIFIVLLLISLLLLLNKKSIKVGFGILLALLMCLLGFIILDSMLEGLI